MSRTTGWDHSVDQPFINNLKQLNDIRDQFNAGKLDAPTYLQKAGEITPKIQDTLNYLSQYSGPAYTWALGQGGDKFQTTYQPEISILTQGKQFLGRDLTSQEVAQALPAFQGPNGSVNGSAFLANLAQQYKSNPSLDPGSKQNTQKPEDIQNGVQQQFQSILGRAPTSDELSHFTEAVKSGQTDLYGLSGFLKQQPEYTNKQDTQFRSGLNTELQNYDVQEFGREKGDIQSQYARNGMQLSPSLDYAMTDLMGKIASNRSAYLANLSASQYGGNKDLAIGNYQNTLNQMNQTNQQNRQYAQGYGSSLLDRGFQGADYRTQMNDYMSYLNNQPKQNGMNPITAALGGAGALAPLGPWGAAAGGAAGLFGYLSQK